MTWPGNELKKLCFNGHMAGSPIKLRNLRILLDAVLRSDSDLNAFCLDYFNEIYRQFAGGMDRTTKYTLLLDKADASEIVEYLREAHPKPFSKYRHLLTDDKSVSAEPPGEAGESAPRWYDRNELFDSLCQLLPAQLDSLTFRLKVPMAMTSSAPVPQASRAAELVRLLEQEGPSGLERLAMAIKQVAPLVLPQRGADFLSSPLERPLRSAVPGSTRRR
ncbi:MAG TPA: hypothetical protein PLW65_09345 [Pseudomonadota bacterium]|nr:hypothetical protein [Pseudomonadota bacterium]